LWLEPAVGPGPFRFDGAVVSIFERNLAAMVRLCRSRGVRPVLATFAGCDDPSVPPAEQRRRMAYVTREIPQLDATTGHAAMELYREVTRRVARDEGTPLVDLARTMPKDVHAYTDTVHFTPAGERRLAELLAAELLAQEASAAPDGTATSPSAAPAGRRRATPARAEGR
jgi:lysophospholipase L1-like esterase